MSQSQIDILTNFITDANTKFSRAKKVEIQQSFRMFLKGLSREISDKELLEFQSRLISAYGSNVALALDPVMHIMSAEYRKGFKTMDSLKGFLTRSGIKGLDDFIKNLSGKTRKEIFTSKMKNILGREVLSEEAYSEFVKNISEDKIIVNTLKTYIEGVIKKEPEMIKHMLTRGEISNGQLSQIKGTVFEILCTPFKLAKLKELKELKELSDKTKLFGDVMVKSSKTLKGTDSANQAFRQIWDDIVAEIDGDKIKIYHIFEMKSGKGGFDEVMDQINRTLEQRLSAIFEIQVNGKEVFKKENIELVMDPKEPFYSVLTAKGRATDMEEMTGGSFQIGEGNFKDEIIQVYYDLAKVGGKELDHLDITQLTIDLLIGKVVL